MPLLDALAVGTDLMLLTLHLQRVRGLVQGEDTLVLGLGRTGKPLSWEAPVNIWLELGTPVSTAQEELSGTLSM